MIPSHILISFLLSNYKIWCLVLSDVEAGEVFILQLIC